MKRRKARAGAITKELSERRREIIRSFNLAERLLYAFSKNPSSEFRGEDCALLDERWNRKDALRVLLREFPDLAELVRGRRVLDYGCGDGFQSVALADLGAAYVLGAEIQPHRLANARRLAEGMANVAFAETPDGSFDVAISLNAFEHFPNPERNLQDLANALQPNGKILLTFSPPWLAPYGAHMFFTYFPWVNVVFSEKTVFRVRELYREDGLRGYTGINKMTIQRFERIVRDSGLEVEQLRYRAVKGMPVLSQIPWLREFMINSVTCVLCRRTTAIRSDSNRGESGRT